ncbi:3-deoxy-D-manno-octulosonic-acid transferase [Hasllibacter halocynthiae]|uniref:3-deoxy-D-manno-octulosonic acid transferase n=1 Tax=Hasllibacter halocynthiae TaxID=595589 RepID=A0A2T0X657_9RHOB|nr:glycosyltransferase N-terminal domain-containing protein [Hasllibacter halocynthiae]PRY94442.1 3-deoxy-D-manno-octulosonic-acid transferase [Hasllibacter halocynthiae]
MLGLYRLLTAALGPVVPALLAASPRRTGEDRAERAGRGGARGDGPLLWAHGASNGELASTEALLRAALERFPAMRLLVTSGTATGRTLAEGWRLDRTSVRLSPWDAPAAQRRMVQGWGPAAYLFAESEIWPNRLLALEAAGVPVVGASVRLSARSARRWGRIAPGAAKRLLAVPELICPQDRATADALRGLGARRIGPVGTLKADLPPMRPPADADALLKAFPRAGTVLAASTHEGEEAFALAAWRRAREVEPGLRLILAPRHPRRLSEVLEAAGPEATVRSRGDVPGSLYVADTLGELRFLYSLARLAFVGGSIAPLGGHTPYEPAAEGCAIAHGPDVSNAAEGYEALGDAAIGVASPEDLARAFALPPEEAASLGALARERLSGGAAKVREAVLDALAPVLAV